MIQKIKADNFEMDCISFGNGKKQMVILPGMDLEKMADSAKMIEQSFSAFHDDFRIYLFDRKDGMKKGYHIWDMAEDTAEAMKLIGISDAYVFGASQGGIISLYIAVNHPKLIKKLVVSSTIARQNETSIDTMETWRDLGRKGDAIALNRDCARRIYSEETLNNMKEYFKSVEKIGSKEQLERFAVLAEGCLETDIYDRLCEIKCPMLAIGSEKDKVFSSKGVKEIAQKTGCELYIYKEYSHAVYDEAPDFKDRIKAFFE